MSDASVQFTELIRQAHAGLQATQLQPGERWHYCGLCGRDTPHTVVDTDAIHEAFICRCGHQTVYAVR